MKNAREEKNTDSMGQIAEQLQVSKATVSKVLRHCSGVDSDTRKRVLQELIRNGYRISYDSPIYCILPDVPQYFWKELRRGICDAEKQLGITIRLNICTRPSDRETVLCYLEEAGRIGVQVIIAAVNVDEEIQEKLELLGKDRFVILLSEYASVRNCFYVGADSFRDGYAMGKLCTENFRQYRPVVFSLPDNPTAELRRQGFLQALREYMCGGDLRYEEIQIQNAYLADHKHLAARLASDLHRRIQSKDSEADRRAFCFYAPVGIPQLPLALHKARFADDTVILCHDCPRGENGMPDPFGSGFAVLCNQAVYEQGVTAVRLAVHFMEYREYPAQKEILIASGIFTVRN